MKLRYQKQHPLQATKQLCARPRGRVPESSEDKLAAVFLLSVCRVCRVSCVACRVSCVRVCCVCRVCSCVHCERTGEKKIVRGCLGYKEKHFGGKICDVTLTVANLIRRPSGSKFGWLWKVLEK